MQERGGAQHIPRPDNAQPGGPPPWVAVPEIDRAPSLDGIADILAARGPGTQRASPATATTRNSAVLVPLYEIDGEVHVVLTRRSAHLRSHRSEVSFPGGRHDETDASLYDTALREAEEEIGLPRSVVEPIGELDHFVTVGSQSLIHPYVGRLTELPELTPQPSEVDEILHPSLRELLLDEVWREELWTFGGAPRAITFFELYGDTVWGATGAMLRQLLAIVTNSDDTLSY